MSQKHSQSSTKISKKKPDTIIVSRTNKCKVTKNLDLREGKVNCAKIISSLHALRDHINRNRSEACRLDITKAVETIDQNNLRHSYHNDISGQFPRVDELDGSSYIYEINTCVAVLLNGELDKSSFWIRKINELNMSQSKADPV